MPAKLQRPGGRGGDASPRSRAGSLRCACAGWVEEAGKPGERSIAAVLEGL